MSGTPPPPVPTPPPDSLPPPARAEVAPGDVPAADGYVGIPRTRAGVLEVLGGILLAVGISAVGVMIVAALDPTYGDSDTSAASDGGTLAAQTFLALSFVAGAIGASAVANQRGLRDALRRLGLRRFSVGKAAAAIGIAIAAYAVAAVILNALLQPEQEDIAENLGAGEDSAVLVTVVAAILVVPVAAFGEEIFFRGLLFGALRQRLPLWPAALVPGLLFGFLHLTAGDVGVALQLTLFGIVCAWVYERSGSLWTAIILHGLNNAIAFTILLTG